MDLADDAMGMDDVEDDAERAVETAGGMTMTAPPANNFGTRCMFQPTLSDCLDPETVIKASRTASRMKRLKFVAAPPQSLNEIHKDGFFVYFPSTSRCRVR